MWSSSSSNSRPSQRESTVEHWSLRLSSSSKIWLEEALCQSSRVTMRRPSVQPISHILQDSTPPVPVAPRSLFTQIRLLINLLWYTEGEPLWPPRTWCILHSKAARISTIPKRQLEQIKLSTRIVLMRKPTLLTYSRSRESLVQGPAKPNRVMDNSITHRMATTSRQSRTRHIK
jgi:hypothetical protein